MMCFWETFSFNPVLVIRHGLRKQLVFSHAVNDLDITAQ